MVWGVRKGGLANLSNWSEPSHQSGLYHRIFYITKLVRTLTSIRQPDFLYYEIYSHLQKREKNKLPNLVMHCSKIEFPYISGLNENQKVFVFAMQVLYAIITKNIYILT